MRVPLPRPALLLAACLLPGAGCAAGFAFELAAALHVALQAAQQEAQREQRQQRAAGDEGHQQPRLGRALRASLRQQRLLGVEHALLHDVDPRHQPGTGGEGARRRVAQRRVLDQAATEGQPLGCQILQLAQARDLERIVRDQGRQILQLAAYPVLMAVEFVPHRRTGGEPIPAGCRFGRAHAGVVVVEAGDDVEGVLDHAHAGRGAIDAHQRRHPDRRQQRQRQQRHRHADPARA
jgi:hypothetical protein